MAVGLRGPVAVVHSRALVVPGACANPRRELLLGGKGRCRGADFGNDLLRRMNAQTGHFRKPPHGVLMLTEQIRHFLVELADLLVDQNGSGARRLGGVTRCG